jgi:hypothetical protein
MDFTPRKAEAASDGTGQCENHCGSIGFLMSFYLYSLC